MVSTRSMIRAVAVTVLVSCVIASPGPRANAQGKARQAERLAQLDNADLLDLLDADLEETFATTTTTNKDTAPRQLQMEEFTMSPTSTPVDDGSRDLGDTPAPSVPVDAGLIMSDAPTAAPTTGSRDIGFSVAPTAAGDDGLLITEAPVTSGGVWRVVPSGMAVAAVAVAALFLV